MSKLNLTIILFLAGIIISLVGYVFADTKAELKTKADNTSILKVIEQMQEQRKEDREYNKEQRQIDREKEAKQDTINQKLLESVQFLILQQKNKEMD